jgi:hypothetical protein
MHLTFVLEHGVVAWLLLLWLIASVLRTMMRAHARIRDERMRRTQRILRRGYAKDIDVFLVHCPDRPEDVYCVPVEEAAASHTYLRVEPTLNGQAQRIRWADDYKLPA